MVILFTGLGLLLFFGGVGTALYGLPYLVLEYGFTSVIGGIVAATGGLVLIGIGVLVREVRRVGLKLTVAGIPAVRPETATPPAKADDLPAPVPDIADTPRPDQQGDLFEPGLARAAVAVAAAGGAVAASRASPFDKIERALEDVLETTRGEGRNGTATTDDEPRPAHPARDPDDDGKGADFAFADSDALAPEPEPEAAGANEEPETRTTDAPPPERRPVSSDEGIVRVYTIGDSSFTMYSDGTIRADTPQGARYFATMDELKAYLDQRPIASSAKA